ncbi:MAG: hypothetical protein M1834_005299 [Cirrosporium novae-zelandiae]|nr:MAG: hypothetical protein M1834_005299 [Cirrosporium novae-zelandiae]
MASGDWPGPNLSSFTARNIQTLRQEQEYLFGIIRQSEQETKVALNQLYQSESKLGKGLSPTMERQLKKKCSSMRRRLKLCDKSQRATRSNLRRVESELQAANSWNYNTLQSPFPPPISPFQNLATIESQMQGMSLGVHTPIYSMPYTPLSAVSQDPWLYPEQQYSPLDPSFGGSYFLYSPYVPTFPLYDAPPEQISISDQQQDSSTNCNNPMDYVLRRASETLGGMLREDPDWIPRSHRLRHKSSPARITEAVDNGIESSGSISPKNTSLMQND